MRRLPGAVLRKAFHEDLEALLGLEALCFDGDRLSRRALARWTKASNCVFLVAELDGRVAGYGLVVLRRTSLAARLYSIALAPEARGRGLARALLEALEEGTLAAGRTEMRLEVAQGNEAAIGLYQRSGYEIFGEWPDYYENHDDAWRMRKRLVRADV